MEGQGSKIEKPPSKKRYSVNFFIIAVLLATALIWGKYWEYTIASKRAIEHVKISMRQSSDFIFQILYKIVEEAEEGEEALENFFLSIKSKKGFAVRMVHSEAVNIGSKRGARQQPEWEKEKESLKDGKIKEWQMDGFLYIAMPLKAKESCRECHYLSLKMKEKIPLGYPIGLVEFKLSLEPIRNRQAELMKHTVIASGLILATVFIFGFVVFRQGKDIEESEEKYRYAEERFKDVALNSGDWIWETDDIGRYLYSSRGIESVLGYTPDKISGMSFIDFVIKEEREKIEIKMLPILKAKESFTNIESKKVRKDGTVIIAESSGTPFLDDDGNLLGYRGVTRDITKARKAEKILRESEQKVRAIIDNLTSFVYMKDLEGRYLLVNQSFLKGMGKTMGDIIGKSHFELFSKGDAEVMDFADKKVIEEKIPYEYEEVSDYSGETRTFLSIKVPLIDNGDEAYGLVGITTDITNRKKAEIELFKSKEAAEKATLLKDKFLSLVSHDLKSPLTTMLGFLHLIKSEKVEPVNEGAELILNSAISSGEHMVQLIDDLLHLSRIKTGKILLKEEFTDAHLIGVRAMMNLSFIAEEKGIKLINDIPPKSRIYCDPALIHEVVQNFITNAIKFSIKGGKIRLYMEKGKSHIHVSDTGVGIKPKHFKHLFSYEKKMTTIGTRGETGTGLGLPLAKEIIEAHGGEIRVKSVVGKGSTFSACLPYVKPKILIVDDDVSTRSYIRLILKNLNADFVEASNGEEALDVIKESSPHLVISDIKMPKLDGFALLKAIRKSKETAELPVILMTADNRPEVSQKALALGASDFLAKPIEPENIIDPVKRFIS